MNKVILIGNTTKDVELNTTNSGKNYARFTLAIKRIGSEETDFINILAWNKLAENCHKFLKKGSKCAVIGKIQINSYETNDRTKKYTTDIVADEVEFLSAKQSNDLTPTDEETPFDSKKVKQETIQDDSLPF